MPEGGFWLDYVADTGDGWDSTYAVARLLALPELTLSEQDQRQAEPRTPRSEAGCSSSAVTACTPAPAARCTRSGWSSPTRRPCGARMRPTRTCSSIPGNHDWYDGLGAFMRLFCANRWIAGRRTRQSRSYFALKLPQRWWLIGTDVQLNSDIDVPQVEYFRAGGRAHGPRGPHHPLQRGARVDSRRHRQAAQGQLPGEQPRVPPGEGVRPAHQRLPRRGPAPLPAARGRRGRQKITAGGGGAFLHPTHAPAAPTSCGTATRCRRASRTSRPPGSWRGRTCSSSATARSSG